jgi:hypothetical protein
MKIHTCNLDLLVPGFPPLSCCRSQSVDNHRSIAATPRVVGVIELTMFAVGQKMIRRKKNVKKGIQFCLMVCGASGTGELCALEDSAYRQSPLGNCAGD